MMDPACKDPRDFANFWAEDDRKLREMTMAWGGGTERVYAHASGDAYRFGASAEISPDTVRLTASWAGDIVADSEKRYLNFLFAQDQLSTFQSNYESERGWF